MGHVESIENGKLVKTFSLGSEDVVCLGDVNIDEGSY
jgi:hypothetical protein